MIESRGARPDTGMVKVIRRPVYEMGGQGPPEIAIRGNYSSRRPIVIPAEKVK